MSAEGEIVAAETAGPSAVDVDPGLLNDVSTLLAEEMNVDLDKVCAATRLDELGVQSIDFVDLLFVIESHFGVELPNLAADDRPLNTIGDVTALVADSLARLRGA